MITISQIKAARSLLDWSQSDLAKAAGLSLPALGNLERGASTPRSRTLLAIEKALTEAGMEFIEGPGVRYQREILKINMLEGKDAIAIMFEDIYAHLRHTGGDLLVGGISEKKFMNIAAAPLMGYLRKVNRHKNLRARLLVIEGDSHFVGKPATSIYRWIDQDSFGLVPYYIYRDKYAVIIWGPPLRVIITQNPSLAETYRRQFEANWKRAQIPPASIRYFWPDEQKKC